jgi:hypothetical protein
MKLIVGMLGFGFGYVLFYYGLTMYRNYDSSNPADTAGTPFSVLLGFNSKWDSVGVMPGSSGSQGVFALPPFTGWTS